jgi:Protein  of unknown function (DUF3018)
MSAPAKKSLTPSEKAERNRQKARDWRAKMHAKGLRPVQLWVVDTRAPGFAEEARRQAQAANSSPRAAEDLAFVEAISIPLDDI